MEETASNTNRIPKPDRMFTISKFLKAVMDLQYSKFVKLFLLLDSIPCVVDFNNTR